MKTVEIWIAMDSDGDFAVSGADAESAAQNYCDEVGGALSLRIVKLTIHMEPPKAEVDAGEITVPAEAGQVTKAEVA